MSFDLISLNEEAGDANKLLRDNVISLNEEAGDEKRLLRDKVRFDDMLDAQSLVLNSTTINGISDSSHPTTS